MKIAVCGKGGCGKSTVTALLAKELARSGKKVLIIDSDESNYGLHRQLGMELPKDFTAFFGGKENVLADLMLSSFTHQFFEGSWSFADIPEGYCGERDGVMLMSSGKIHEANEGCACAMNTVIQQFIANLRLMKGEFAILDLEAGIEHFGRGVDNGVDMLIMIVDPSFESLRLSKKIQELADSIGKPVWFILNKVTEDTREAMLEAVADKQKVAAIFPADSALAAAGLIGKELTGSYPDIHELAQKLITGKLA